jgi:hypothetical protein
MPFDSESFEIDDAKASSQDLYEVQFPDWGVRDVPAGQVAVNQNFQFPPPGAKAIPSLAGIAIGPRSTIDRCWVSWDRQKIVNATPNGSEPPTAMESRVRQLSVQCPLMFTQASKIGSPLPSTMPAPVDINNSPVTAMHNGLLYVFPKEPWPNSIGTANSGASSNAVMTQAAATTILPANYVDQLGTARPLLIPPAGSNIIYPYLELYLFLRPPLFAPPLARFPLFTSYVQPTPAAYTAIGYVPIFGRRRVTVGLQNLAEVTSYTLGVIPCIRENDPGGNTPPFEIPAGSAAAVAAGKSVGFQLDNPCADYLVIYANPANPSAVAVQVAAYD